MLLKLEIKCQLKYIYQSHHNVSQRIITGVNNVSNHTVYVKKSLGLYSQTSIMRTLFVETKLSAILIFRIIKISAEKFRIIQVYLCSNFFGAYRNCPDYRGFCIIQCPHYLGFRIIQCPHYRGLTVLFSFNHKNAFRSVFYSY